MVYDVTFRELQPNNEHEFDLKVLKTQFLHRWRSEANRTVCLRQRVKPST